ncbi:sulfotransferase family protein [Formosa haliotis]|uniref:sulfotransferase family protein n=1 Tax=Formosa haliotis TaxID=1555194 RepID=UPI001146C31E|nr:sulfotransferase [Formosa haliotis]
MELKKIITKLRYGSKEPIFIIGCGHSGTSIMLSILSFHPEVYGIPNETFLFLDKPFNYNLIKKYFNDAGNKRLLEKTPKHVSKITDIIKVFPKAKFIVMVRDGRDVASSLKKRNGDYLGGVNRWVNDNNLWLNSNFSENIFMVKLEELTLKGYPIIEEVLNFLNLKPYPEIMNYHKEEREFFKNNRTNKEYDDHTQYRNTQINRPLQASTVRWINEISDEEKAVFKDKANDLLIQFGYEKNQEW